MTALRDAALEYAARGWPVLPLHEIGPKGCSCADRDCKKNAGKHPRTAHGFKDASTEPATIRKWWRCWPRANVGIVTGCKASGLLVLDIDPRSGGLESLKQIEDKLPRTTLAAQSGGGGTHWYFTLDREARCSAGIRVNGAHLPGLDIKADDGYIVAPPSRTAGPYEWMNKAEPAPAPEFLVSSNGHLPQTRIVSTPGEPIPDGQRSATLTSLAGTMRRRGMTEPSIAAGLKVENAARCQPPLADARVEAIARSVTKLYEPARAEAIGPQPRTDAGNAEAFALLFGDRIRFDHRRACWLVFREHSWTPDCEAEIRRLGVEAARVRYQRAMTIADIEARRKEAAWAIASESRQKVEAMLYFAQALPPISDPGIGWDSDPLMLGCANGVVDLGAGTLRPGTPEDRISMTTALEYDPAAQAPRWEKFLAEIFEDDQQMMSWHHRAIGYSATADVSEQMVYFKNGNGGNGKSVHDEAIRNALGDYAHNLSFVTLERNARASIPSDLAHLPGRRFVTASETNEGTRLDEARLKALSGCDSIRARHLFGREFEFRPVAKVWLSVNHLPRVTDDSFGFWRRVRLLPFQRQFRGHDIDRNLPATLRAEACGVLSWIVRGAVLWANHGLEPCPESVQLATKAYEAESDALADFRSDRCVLLPDVETPALQLFKAYQAWADDAGLPVKQRLTLTAFGRRMSARHASRRTDAGKVYMGVAVKP